MTCSRVKVPARGFKRHDHGPKGAQQGPSEPWFRAPTHRKHEDHP